MWRIRAKRTASGRSDVLDYIDGLDEVRRATLVARIFSVINSDPPETFKRVRNLGDDVYEIRSSKDRLLFTFGLWNSFVVLLLAHPKQKAKAEKRYLDQAVRLRKEAEQIHKQGGESWPEIQLKTKSVR